MHFQIARLYKILKESWLYFMIGIKMSRVPSSFQCQCARSGPIRIGSLLGTYSCCISHSVCKVELISRGYILSRKNFNILLLPL